MLFKDMIAIGNRVYFEDRWWIVEDVTPLFIRLKRPGNDERAIVPSEALMSKGFIYEEEPQIDSYQESDEDNQTEKPLDFGEINIDN